MSLAGKNASLWSQLIARPYCTARTPRLPYFCMGNSLIAQQKVGT